jgi:hypothetical protein
MQQLTVHKILRTCLRFKNYKHQLLQHATAQDKEVHYTFCCIILSKLEDIGQTFYSQNFYENELPKVDLPHGHLILQS